MMTAEQLKGSILQLAMQGKLVEQRPEEGTGEDLYKTILAEKKKLIKERKIKKQKSLPEISEDEIPFEIPDTWLWVRVTEICTKLVDGDHNPPKGISGTSEFIMASSRNINQDRLVDLDQVRYLNKDTFLKENERTLASKGDIFFTSVGSLGRSCVYDGSLNICFQRSVSVMTTLIFNHYLKRCFDSEYFQNKVNREATGTAQKGFYLNQLAAALIPLPPLEEQKRIVAKIEELMPFVEQYAAASTKLNTLNVTFPEMMKKSILQEAVQGKLVPQDPNDEPASLLLKRITEEKKRLVKEGKIKKEKKESVIFRGKNGLFYETVGKQTSCIQEQIPFDIPESWEWLRLRSYGQFSSGKTPSMSNPKNWVGNIPWVSPKDMKTTIIKDSQMHISQEASKDMVLYPAGTLLMVVRSGILKRKLPLCVLGVDSTINQDIKAFTLYYNELSEWVYYELRGFEYYILHNLVKNVTTVDSLKFDEFQDLLVPLPPRAEQIRIINRVKEIIQDIDSLTIMK